MCPECEQTYLNELAVAAQNEERRKAAHVRQIVAWHPELKDKIMKRLAITSLETHFSVDAGAYQEVCEADAIVSHAKNLEMARRLEDAAVCYEKLGLWKEAGLVRDKKSARTVKHVTVNLNDLIEKLRTGGLSVPYKCGSCGAAIVIDKNANADGLKFCSYCGSALNTDTLVDVLREALK